MMVVETYSKTTKQNIPTSRTENRQNDDSIAIFYNNHGVGVGVGVGVEDGGGVGDVGGVVGGLPVEHKTELKALR